VLAVVLALAPAAARAWGDKGHQVIAQLAWRALAPDARAEVERLLALDRTPLAMGDGGSTRDSFDRQSTWADYYRDTQRRPGLSPERIHSYTWHFADIELQDGSLEQACRGFPALVPGTAASDGQDPDCIVNKLEQFAAELASPAVPDAEKLLALKFLLHFVGDVHQPLHAADDHDRGGNDKLAIAGGTRAPLHRHWDVTFVELLAGATAGRPDAAAILAALPAASAEDIAAWQRDPNPRRWALESFAVARDEVYGGLPAPSGTSPDGKPIHALEGAYVDRAKRVVATQLARAGYRLAALLTSALSRR
jgi:hypothetical protein